MPNAMENKDDRNNRNNSVFRMRLFIFGCALVCTIPLQTSFALGLPLAHVHAPRRSLLVLRQAKDQTSRTSSTNKNAPAAKRSAVESDQQPRKRNNNDKSNNKNNNINRIFPNCRQINQQLVQCESAKEVLQLIASQKGALTDPAGGGILNSVNFSTAVHRIARHLSSFGNRQNNSQQQQQQQQQNGGSKSQQQGSNSNDTRYNRAVVLSDPRFALLLCSLAEALGGIVIDEKRNYKVLFGSREMSNMAWALAKMKIAPPREAAPVLDDTNDALLDTAYRVRQSVMEVAKAKQEGQGAAADAQLWIPNLSLLCGHIMDTIAARATDHSSTFAVQERANLLWALATAGRARHDVFDIVMNKMIDDMQNGQEKVSYESHDDVAAGTSGEHRTNNKNQNNQRNESFLNPQEFSNSIWAFATTQTFGRAQERLLAFTAEMLDTHEEFRNMFKPQEFSNSAWGVATLLSKKEKVADEERDSGLVILRHVAKAVAGRAAEFKTQELSNTAWAFATLGFGTATLSNAAEERGSLNDYVTLESNDPEGDEELLNCAMQAILESAQPRLHRFRSQELNNLAWALARLDRRDATDTLEAIGLQIIDRRRPVTPQDIGTTLWSLATLEYVNDDVYRGIASRLTVDRARHFKPQELSNTLLAMARAEVIPKYLDIYDSVLIPKEEQFAGPLDALDDPVTLCFGVAAQELMRRPFEFKDQEIKDILWSFSKVGMRYPDLFKSVAEHLIGRDGDVKDGKSDRYRSLDDFSPQGLCNMAWAFATQAQLVIDVTYRVKNIAANVENSGKMAVYATSFFDIGEILIQRLFAAIAEANLKVHDNLSSLKPQDLSNTAWAMAVLGMRHTPFLEAATQQLEDRARQFIKGHQTSMTRFKGQELANLLWAFATLNFHISNDIGDLVGEYMAEISKADKQQAAGIAQAFIRQELANIAWSLAVFSVYPKKTMHLLYAGLVGIGSERNPAFLCKCFGDKGLQHEAIMSLIYVQLAMEMEGLQNGLTLPENFPDNWNQKSASSRRGDVTATSFELKLSTSRVQRAVSDAFHRIGFDHDVEHIITMEELLDNNGVPVSKEPREILSIDLANVNEMVAIEVDGPPHFVTDIETIPSQCGVAKRVNGRLQYQFYMDGDRQQINGPTALKKHLLQRLGWRTINIPFWEWYGLGGDGSREEAYCRNLLEQLVKP